MKTINTYITEKLKISKNKYTLFPKYKSELEKMIENEINKNGNECDLNHIDVSKITDMRELFSYELKQFNGDISQWDVSNVETMSAMFSRSYFNGDISGWDVSNVKSMGWMFIGSSFNQDIANWDVSNVENMGGMFAHSKFNGDISRWDVSNVENMEKMFSYSIFNQDISNWQIHNKCIINNMLFRCPILIKYKPKFNS